MAKEVTLQNHPLLDERGKEAILPPSESGRSGGRSLRGFDWRQVAGVLLIAGGLLAVVAGWIGVTGTSITADQLSYIGSGGLLGVALIALGVVLLVSYEHLRDRSAMAELSERLGLLEEGLAGRFRGGDR
ncbi:MAG: hypothetical protein AB1679_00685 [Actinomycetota bacterium]